MHACRYADAVLKSYLFNRFVSGHSAEGGRQLSHVHFAILAYSHGWVFLCYVFALLHLFARLFHLQLRLPGLIWHVVGGCLTLPGQKHNDRWAFSGRAHANVNNILALLASYSAREWKREAFEFSVHVKTGSKRNSLCVHHFDLALTDVVVFSCLLWCVVWSRVDSLKAQLSPGRVTLWAVTNRLRGRSI